MRPNARYRRLELAGHEPASGTVADSPARDIDLIHDAEALRAS